MSAKKTNQEEIQPAEERAHPRARRLIKFSSAIGVIVLAVAALIVIPSLVAFSPTFCATCHVDQYATWKQATHKNVSCTDCHIQANSWEAFKARIGILDKLVIKMGLSRGNRNITGFNALPMDKNCDVCHKLKRNITPAGDLIIPHESHTKLRKLLCVNCHHELVHSAKAKTGNKPSMIGCYRCHDGTKAPNSCGACHTEKSLPDDHKQADWLRIHSIKQKQDPAYCDRCHGWVKDYCKECHQRKPRSHDKTWPATHQGLISTDRREGCAKCHGAQRCLSCHTKTKKIARPKT